MNAVERLIASKGAINTYAEAQDEEVIAYLEEFAAELLNDARKDIILAKQASLIEALSEEVTTGTGVDEKDEPASADTEG